MASAVKPGNRNSAQIRYIFGKELGFGQFGIIRECYDKLTGELLACKTIPKTKLTMESLKLEILTMAEVSGHPNIVKIKAVHEEKECVHLMMELCSGGDLFDHLQKHGSLSEYRANNVFRSLMQVLVHCHDRGIVHRDLKPENILMANDSSSSPIKVADFGLATFIRPGLCLHEAVGTPHYVAPEVLGKCYDQAADVWSAGVILHVLLYGRSPFLGDTVPEILHNIRTADVLLRSDHRDQISESAKNLIKSMLEKDPSKRLTAHQVLEHPWMGDSITMLPHQMFAHNGRCYQQLHDGEGEITPMMFEKDVVSCRVHQILPSPQNHKKLIP